VEKVFIAGGLMATVGLFINGILFSKIRLVKTLGSKHLLHPNEIMKIKDQESNLWKGK